MRWAPGFLNTSPMFEPLRPAANGLEQLEHWPDIAELELLRAHQSIVTKSGKPIRFVTHETSPQEFVRQYEPRIYLTGEVQTRTKNWHDLFNALVWLTFPRAKATLNQLHYRELLREHECGLGQRGAARDAATLFDESGVVVVSADVELSALLRNFSWKELFWQRRAAVLTRMKFFIFGHGLYEKALNPYVGMTGKALILDVGQHFFNQTLAVQLQEIDLMLEQHWCASAAALTPLPLLGYPAWSAHNAEESYYDNQNYFRSQSALP